MMSRALLCAGAAFVLSALSPAGAAAQARRVNSEDLGTVLSAAALDGTAAARTTSAMFTEGASTIALGVELVDANSSVTSINLTCTGSLYNATTGTFYTIPVIVSTSATGTVTYKQLTASLPLTGTTNYTATFGVTGHKWVKCVCTAVGTAATADTCTIRARVSTP